MTDDYSVDNTQMQSTTDPGEVGTESKATTLAGELERLRLILKEITGEAQWYVTPALGTVVSQADAEAGTSTARRTWTAERVKQAIAALLAATQAEMEAATSTTVAATPGRTQYHPGVAKAWLNANVTGGINESYNVTSVTDTGVGLLTITWATDFSTANYATLGTPGSGSARLVTEDPSGKVGGSVQMDCRDDLGALADPTVWLVAAFGDQA